MARQTRDVRDDPYVEADRTTVLRPANQEEIRVPVAEERLEVEKRPTEVGEVRLHKTVETEEKSLPVEVMREEVHVERRVVDERPLAEADASATAFQEGTIRIPVRGEEVVVNKRPVVTGEVVVTKERTTELRQVSDTLRREHVDMEEDYQRARPHFESHFQGGHFPGGRDQAGHSFAEAEPWYREGYTWGRDQRYSGRQFEDVEPELRRTWETDRSGRGRWEDLREAMRAGWNRARGL